MKDPSLSRQFFTATEPLFSTTKMSVKASSLISAFGVCEGNNSHRTDHFSGSCAAGEDQFHRASSQSGTVGCIHGSPVSPALRSVLQQLIKYFWVLISTRDGQVSIRGLGPIRGLSQSFGARK